MSLSLTLLRSHAMVRARAFCSKGYATLSEEQLAEVIYAFCLEINDTLIEDHQHLLDVLASLQDTTLLPPIQIKKQDEGKN